jgi:hypothetical protein
MTYSARTPDEDMRDLRSALDDYRDYSDRLRTRCRNLAAVCLCVGFLGGSLLGYLIGKGII